MADRPDIDALLISALYGELTPAEETRLASHLESHPADRTLLADLTHARNVVRESRILQVQFDPPQAVSALLLQEAARRAPKASTEEKEGWFARFVRSFAAHPAMAAAAMLVVVIGVATFVTRHKGDHFAESTAPATTAKADQSKDEAAEGGAPPAAEPTVAITGDQGNAAGNVAAGSASATTEQYPVDLYAADKNQEADKKADERQMLAKEAKPEPAKDKVAGNFGGTKGGVEVRSRSPEPKDFDDAPAPARKKSAEKSERLEDSFASDGLAESSGTATIARGDLPGGGAAGGAGAPRTTSVSPPPPPPPPPPAAPAAPTATASSGPRAGMAQATDDARPADPALAWAREQHQSVVAQVRAGNCKNAANLAVTLSTRAPGYYSQNVATDRQVKDCLAYINTEVSRDAELRAQRERAKRSSETATKRAADQPSKPASKAPAAATETTK